MKSNFAPDDIFKSNIYDYLACVCMLCFFKKRKAHYVPGRFSILKIQLESILLNVENCEDYSASEDNRLKVM